MAKAAISHAECNAIHILREMSNDATRKQVKREIFARAKAQFMIPANHKLLVEVDTQNASAGILKNKATREDYELDTDTGVWVGATNGANEPQAWFKLPANALQEALTDALDNLDASEGNVSRSTTVPVNAVAHPSNPDIMMDQQGNMWVKLDADAYEQQDSQEEDEDDLPF